MRVLGVDPGVNGGLSVIEITDGTVSVLVGWIDIPVRVDVAAISNFITGVPTLIE